MNQIKFFSFEDDIFELTQSGKMFVLTTPYGESYFTNMKEAKKAFNEARNEYLIDTIQISIQKSEYHSILENVGDDWIEVSYTTDEIIDFIESESHGNLEYAGDNVFEVIQ